MTILDEILARKREEVEAAKARIDAAEMASRAQDCVEPTRGFRTNLAAGDAPVVIAEIKRRSPSKGVIRADFDPVRCACDYAEAGAACLSVLTDESFFGGHLDYLGKIRAAVSLPLLRKDFVIDPYQIDESRVAGADAILLIVSALEVSRLKELRDRARELDLDVLVEVHTEDQLETARGIGADLIGVNNRDLETFTTNLANTERLAALLGSEIDGGREARTLLVAESGIRDREDIRRLEAAGARAFLVGESLMAESNLIAALRRLRGVGKS